MMVEMTDVSQTTKKIPPEMFHPICHAIGDHFSFVQLDAIIYICFADHKINNYASPNLPPREIAIACLTALEKEGLIVIFLANILTLLTADSTLYGLIVTAIPETKTAILQINRNCPT
jgi:hypothetical protein